MTRRRAKAALILLTATALISLNQPQGALCEKIIHGRVTKVIDGDTIVVQTGGESRVVRLIGIDSPEVARNGQPGEYMSLEAKEFVRVMVEGKEVALEFDMEREDRYGRWLCYVYGEEREMVNETLIKNGLALTMTHFPFREKKRFIGLEGEAKRKGLGLFRGASLGALVYATAAFEPIEVYRGPSRTFIVVYRNLGKPWLREAEIAEEIERIGRYERSYPQSLMAKALKTDGYINLKEREEETEKGDPPVIDYREAGAFIGRYVILEGEVVRTKNTGKVTFLDFDNDWKNNVSIVIFDRDAKKFPDLPDRLYAGKTIRVRGQIKLYKGRPEVVVSEPQNIQIQE